MPATATDYTQTAQETTLKTIRQGQQAIVEGVRAKVPKMVARVVGTSEECA